MSEDNEKITSPFVAPEGYFENFESKLRDRMDEMEARETHLRTIKRRMIVLRVSSAAAAAVMITVVSWFMMKKEEPGLKPENNLTKVKSPAPQIVEKYNIPDSAATEINENAIAEELASEMETGMINLPATVSVKLPSEPGTDQALVQAGLISGDAENAIFDEFEL